MFMEKMLQKIKQECGAMLVLTAVLLPVMLGFAGLAVDVGNLYVHKTRLQNTADAAVMAGGMAYIDNLNKKKEKLADKSVALSPDEVINARSGMESAANNYIGKNNPHYMEKLNTNQGNNSKLYEIGTRTNSEDGNKTTEYFRVKLTETVPVHFLPVLGIQNIADVSVYATAKITDTEAKIVNNESSGTYPPDGGEDPLVVAGTLLGLGKNVTYDFKMYITGETKEIQN